jgi:glutaryl-CoA dehydrogenase (non-decarboxylating)
MQNDCNNAASALDDLEKFIRIELAPQAGQFDRLGMIPPTLIAQAKALGLFSLIVDKAYGGLARSNKEIATLCEHMGGACASFLSLYTVHSMVTTAVAKLGNAQQKEKYLPLLAQGKLLAAFSLSEPNAGSNVSAVQTTICQRDNTLVISGRKKWISFGQIADIFLVVGQLNNRPVAVLLPRDTPGLTITPINDMHGFKAAMLAELAFDECVVAPENIVGSTTMGLAQIVGTTLDFGRFSIACGSLGIAQASLDVALKYAKERKQFDKSLLDFQMIKDIIADMIVDVRASRLLCHDAAVARQENSIDAVIKTSVAKYHAAKVALQVSDQAVQVLGANGLSDAFPAARYLRDAKIMNIIEGSVQIHKQVIADHNTNWMV